MPPTLWPLPAARCRSRRQVLADAVLLYDLGMSLTPALTLCIHILAPTIKVADVVVDSIFGFGFSGSLRSPFDSVLTQMVAKCGQLPIV